MGVRRDSSILFGLLLSIACIYSTNAQSVSCPLITIDDLGSTSDFSSNGLVARGIVPPGEANAIVPVKIRTFTTVCDASGNRINTSSFISVVVEFQCDFQSATASLDVCSDPSTIATRQYQFECTDSNGQPVWDASVSGSNLNVQTISPTADLSTPLDNQCRRCIDNEQTTRQGVDPTTHCDPCSSQCDRGQGRCYLGQSGDMCCNFYLQGDCVTDCPNTLVNDTNFNCVCPALSLVNGNVSHSMEMGVERNIGSVATHTCNAGSRLIPQGMGNTRTCSTSGWSDPGFMCELIVCPDLNITNGVVGYSPPGRLLNSVTVYECDSGYELRGNGNRVCQEDRSWNGTDPKCDDCSVALEDPNCLKCGFDSNGMSICTECKAGYKVQNGKCEKEGETSASRGSCDTGCIIGIVLAILGAIILSIVVVLVVYAVYRYLSNPATKLAKTGTEGLNGVARDNPLYLPPEEIVGDIGDVETA